MNVRTKLLIVNNIPTPYRAFMFNTLFEVGKEFGVDVSVVFQSQQERRRFWKPEEMEMHFPHTFGKRAFWRRGSPVKYFTGLTINLDIIRQISWGGYEYVLMGNMQSATQWLSSFLPIGKTFRLLWTESNLDSTNRKRGPAKWLKRFLLGRCAALVCPGERAVECVRFFNSQAAAKPVLWLPNIVDDSIFVERLRQARANRESIRQQLGVTPEECLFLGIGRHIDYKGFGHLIEAFREIHGRYRLILLGDGPLHETWRQRVESIGLSNSILLPGNVGEMEVVRHMAAADWFIHPALQDPSPLVMIEATMAGLPVAVSRQVGNAPETVVDGQNGFVFDTNEHRGLVRVIQRMLDMPVDQRQAMGQRSAELARERFDPRHVAERFFRDMLALPHPTATNGAD
jgi:glycosyltransferase involved in cell wall biosynthesis